MADDIIPLRRSYVQTMVERISDLEAEIERLQAAGDALAKSLAEFNDPEDEMRLLTWREVRRG